MKHKQSMIFALLLCALILTACARSLDRKENAERYAAEQGIEHMSPAEYCESNP